MSHEITKLDRVGLLGKQAWHGLGVVISEELTAVEAAKQFGLTWEVERFPLFAKSGEDGKLVEIESHVANIRTADQNGNPCRELLGVVGADYQICQNRELAEFADALSQTGKVVVETCGSIKAGRKVWFLLRAESFEIGSKDKVHSYVLISNAHDGTMSIYVIPTSVRVVCSNTFHYVTGYDGERADSSAAIAIRHSGKIKDKLQQAKHALKYYDETVARNREMMEAMQASRMSQEQGVQLFAGVYTKYWRSATQTELNSTDKKVRELAGNRISRQQEAMKTFLNRYYDEQSKVGLGATKWAWFNALTGFVQHDKKVRAADEDARAEAKVATNLFGTNVERTHDILNGVLAVS